VPVANQVVLVIDFTPKKFEKFEGFSKPEILRCSLASVLLQLVAIGISNIQNFDFMDKPSDENLKQAIELLEKFKAIESGVDNLTYKVSLSVSVTFFLLIIVDITAYNSWYSNDSVSSSSSIISVSGCVSRAYVHRRNAHSYCDVIR